MNLYKSNTYISDLKTTVDMIVNVGHLSGRSILVTGATGLIGSYIIDTLIMCNKKLNTDIKIYQEYLKSYLLFYNIYSMEL